MIGASFVMRSSALVLALPGPRYQHGSPGWRPYTLNPGWGVAGVGARLPLPRTPELLLLAELAHLGRSDPGSGIVGRWNPPTGSTAGVAGSCPLTGARILFVRTHGGGICTRDALPSESSGTDAIKVSRCGGWDGAGGAALCEACKTCSRRRRRSSRGFALLRVLRSGI